MERKWPKPNSSRKQKSDQQKSDNPKGSAWIVQDQPLNAGYVKEDSDSDIVLDTGATNHIFNDESLFTTLTPSNNSVQTASGVCIPVTGIGSVEF